MGRVGVESVDAFERAPSLNSRNDYGLFNKADVETRFTRVVL